MKKTLIFLMLAGFIPASFAQSQVDPFCLDDPAVCEQKAAKKAEKREKIRQRCAEDPQWCQEWRRERQRQHAERRALRKQCKENPNQCDELKLCIREAVSSITGDGCRNADREFKTNCSGEKHQASGRRRYVLALTGSLP